MKDIQTKTTQWAAKMAANFTPNLCLFYCYCFCAGIEFDTEAEALLMADRYRRRKILDEDGTVLDADRLIAGLTGRRVQVTKRDISSLDEITSQTPVRYDYGTKSHWVVAADGKIVFNSIEDSQCVKKGKPVTARDINWKF